MSDAGGFASNGQILPDPRVAHSFLPSFHGEAKIQSSGRVNSETCFHTLRTAITPSASGMVRAESSVFTSSTSCFTTPRTRVTVFASQSTSFHCKPRVSEIRSPELSVTITLAAGNGYGLPAAIAPRKARTSIGLVLFQTESDT
jgi:hypothetical protein